MIKMDEDKISREFRKAMEKQREEYMKLLRSLKNKKF